MPHDTEIRSIMDQEQDSMFIYNGETHSDIPSIQNFNHILQNIKFFTSAAHSPQYDTYYCCNISQSSDLYTLVYRLPEDCGVPPRHVTAKQETVFFFMLKCAYVGLKNGKFSHISTSTPIQLAARCMAWVCGRSLAGIVASNSPPPGAGMSLLGELGVAR
jgi:hypothetical protein